MKSVLFICLGNICRSPAAQGIFRKLVIESGCRDSIRIDSAGTGDWHIGHPPDPRAIATALNRGIDISGLKARQVTAADLAEFDYIMAMDKNNKKDLMRLANHNNGGGENIHLFLEYAHRYQSLEIPDPYYGGEQDFNQVLDMIEDASRGLLDSILQDDA